MTDREITNALRGSSARQQPINQSARNLEAKGKLTREKRPDGKIGNYPAGAKLPSINLAEARTIESVTEKNVFNFEYNWAPFIVNGKHYGFNEDQNIRLEKTNCSHWGPAIYKWEGRMTEGEHKGKTGILIGETNNIRARLNQYKSGTQTSGNKFWREHFLTKGKIYYWILNLASCSLSGRTIQPDQLKSKNFRLVLEQLLVLDRLMVDDPSKIWIVNRMQ